MPDSPGLETEGADRPFTGRNIIILSDGTGQRGGVLVDERRSNIYKLFRATRCGPDSAIDPARQVAFYDAGLGTLPGGIDSPAAAGRTLYNIASQATGMGITRNIVDCYAAIVKTWRPDDRIFLFGFSRGAYTVRCLGGVLKQCGIPTQAKNGGPLAKDLASARKIAREAVAIYNFTNSRPVTSRTRRQSELLKQRSLLAAQFRTTYQCDGINGGNARPYFIGVFDTVASLANPAATALLAIIALAVIAVISLGSIWLPFSYWQWATMLTLGTGAFALVANLASRFKVAFGLPGVKWWRTLHFATARMKMYDTELDSEVKYARHALSIDEARASFERVPWGASGQWKGGQPVWFSQMWFAGNHSDIGGSYPEDESRLSDIPLSWMLDAAVQCGLNYDPTVLRPYPDPAGMQHDETRKGVFKLARKNIRQLREDAPLHPSVITRFDAGPVQQFDVAAKYRPEGLRNHRTFRDVYAAEPKGPSA